MSDTGAPALTSLFIKNHIASDVAAFVGEVARPYALISIFTAIAWGFLTKSDTTALGVMVAGGTALYGAKGMEKIVQARADADVNKTRANAESGIAPVVDTAALTVAGDKQLKAADIQTDAAQTQLDAANKGKKKP